MMDQAAKVLIVDDKDANRHSIECILRPLKLSTHHACSGAEALHKVLQSDYAIILLDVVMPNINGYETARLIHNNKQFKHIPIVMITAQCHSVDQQHKAYEAGAIDYITEPIDPVTLVNKVNQFIELYRQRLAAKVAQMEQEQVANRMQALLNSAGEGILGIDLTGKISFANPKACDILHIDHQPLLCSHLQDFLPCHSPAPSDSIAPDCFDDNEDSLGIVEILNNGDHFTTYKQRWISALGDKFFVEFSSGETKGNDGKTNGAVVMFQNVSERKSIEDKLIYLANFDPMTNLGNRAYFYDALERDIARSKRTKSTLALLFLDLDHFKDINDSLGHDAGDQFLRETSLIISASIRTGDIAARIGGDEFAVILHDIHSIAATIKVAEKIIKNIGRPITLRGNSLTTSISIGIAIYDQFELSMEELVKSADIALYAAKNDGRSMYKFFNPSMQKQAEEKNRIILALHEAISNNQLSVYYQPKLSSSLDKVVGLEALLRWTTTDGKSISPATFIPIAEESGKIHELGTWVFMQVCQQIERWRCLPGFDDLVVSVNVSAHQLQMGNLHLLVKDTLNNYGFSPKHLEFELTETAIMKDPTTSAKRLQAIQDLGISISIDDFGTGYSSLNYLKRLPIDVLKIDRCFIKDIGHDRHDEEIIKIVVAIAKTMDIDVIAEGVETKQQLAFLSSIGCDLGQGYFFSKALDSEETTQMIENIDTVYQSRFIEFHAYMRENNIQPLVNHLLH
ncbi:MAG: EAL domain-containing protein [Pseudomonadales bacterium]